MIFSRLYQPVFRTCCLILIVIGSITVQASNHLTGHYAPELQTSCDHNVAAGDVVGLVGAIEAAKGNLVPDTVCLGGGTYTFTTAYMPNLGTTATVATPLITDELTIIGNGSTIAKSLPSDQYRYFEVGTFGNLTLRDLHFSGGYNSIYNNEGELTLEATTFENITGAAILNYGELTLDEVSIYTSNGTAIYNRGAATILNSELVGNTGGGINHRGGSLNVDGTLFHNNRAANEGGAIATNGGDVTISNSTFDGNSTKLYGGAIKHGAGTTNITTSILPTTL